MRLTVITLIAITASALCILRFGLTWILPFALAVTAILLTITVIDHDTQEIPDKFILALIPLAVVAVWLQPEVTLLSRGIGFVVISVPMLGLALVINGAFGGGDIKLMAVCGFLLGWQRTLFAFFVALMIGTIWGIFLRVKGKNKRGEPIAFGPALCAGLFTAMVYGGEVVNWYWNLLFYI
jgi:leader peptidase (prepilin peptidase)/N-methyltransferase